MGKPGNTGIRRIQRATVYSMQGFGHAFRNEAAFRQEIALTVVLTPSAFWLGRSPLEIAMLIGVCLIMLIVELLNTAVEAAIDRHGDERHELSGAAKDLGSAAVFVSLVLVAVVWLAVVYDRFY
ncbi:MAG: diacylglycerol kinase [Gammaproteobacteria bacterium]